MPPGVVLERFSDRDSEDASQGAEEKDNDDDEEEERGDIPSRLELRHASSVVMRASPGSGKNGVGALPNAGEGRSFMPKDRG